MILIETFEKGENACWPRTSGDDPISHDKAEEVVKLAPHERG